LLPQPAQISGATLALEQAALLQEGPMDLLIGWPVAAIDDTQALGRLASRPIEGLATVLCEDSSGLVGQAIALRRSAMMAAHRLAPAAGIRLR